MGNISEQLAAVCVLGLSANWGEAVAGNCQMFAREVAEHTGGKPKKVMDLLRAGTAKDTLENFIGTPYMIWNRHSGEPMPVIQEGDYLYKNGEDAGYWAGHVGIAINGRRVGWGGEVVGVGENSHYHTSHAPEPGNNLNVRGAKGVRSLARFGKFTAIVRLTV